VDLALGHLAALSTLQRHAAATAAGTEGGGGEGSSSSGCCTPVNLGTGSGVSVLDLVKGMEKATGE
jgi:UDP-glucose 4-epimerase